MILKNDCKFTNTEEKSNIPSESEEIIHFLEACIKGDEANLYSCCCLKHGYSKPKCYNLHFVQVIFVSIQKNAQTSFKIFLQPRIMVDGAKFNSHDSGSHFKKSHGKKILSIFVTELNLQVILNIQSLHRYALLFLMV